MVGKYNMSVGEIHYGCYAKGEIVVKAHLAKHADVETAIPCVLVAGNKRLCLIAVSIGICYRTYILKFKVLEMRSHDNSEVHRAQVAIRAVLYRPFLCTCHQ